MSTHLDLEFIQRMSHGLKGYVRKGDGKHHFCCPYCGDNKKRAGFFTINGSTRFSCFKCQRRGTLSWFMKDPENPMRSLDLHGEYQMERFRERTADTPPPTETLPTIPDSSDSSDLLGDLLSSGPAQVESPAIAEKKSPLAEMVPARKSRIARRYLSGRGFDPDSDACADVLYTDDFAEWANRVCGKDLRETGDDPRIVFPLARADGTPFGAQGRAVTATKLRYVTALLDDDVSTCYGEHARDVDATTWVCEGVLDSKLLPNCLAALNADLSTFAERHGLSRDSTVLAFDNEPGNKHIVKAVSDAVESGWTVAFWRERQSVVGKDVNDAVQNGRDSSSLFDVHSGLSARLAMARWKGSLM